MSVSGNLTLKKHAISLISPFFSNVVLIISFLFALTGCLPGKVPLSAANFSSPRDALENTLSKSRFKGTLKAIARTEIITSRGRYPARIAVILQKPSFLRIENIPVIGSPDFFLSIKENVLKVFLPQKGEFYIGEANTKNISSFFPISLPVEDMLSIMTGTCPVVDERDQTLEGITEGKLYRIDVLLQNNKKQSIWIDLADNRLVRIDAFGAQGNILYSVRFANFVRAGIAVLPREVIITTGETGKPAITFEYSDLHLSEEMGLEVFDLPLPVGVEPIMMN